MSNENTEIKNCNDVESAKQKELVERIYGLHQKGIVIGLTGRTGSGCSSTANVLCAGNLAKSREIAREVVDNLEEIKREENIESACNTNDHIDELKKQVVETFLEKNLQKFDFKTIKIRHIILLYATKEMEFSKFLEELENREKGENFHKVQIDRERESENIEKAQQQYSEIKKHAETFFNLYRETSPQYFPEIDTLIYKLIPNFDLIIKKIDPLKIAFSDILQNWANDIRTDGRVSPFNKCEPTNDYEKKELDPSSCTFTDGQRTSETIVLRKKRNHDSTEIHPEELANAANYIISSLNAIKRNGTETIYIIDSLRNPFEIIYLKSKIPSFYLFSINMNSELRNAKLKKAGLYERAIKEIDEELNDSQGFVHTYTSIDISKCIELSDIFIDLNLDDDNLFSSYFCQLETYLALLLHPGLIPPTQKERIMQIALAAKLNSGCLSRQVGAAVTNSQYSLLSIGWNIVPGGQTPCNLRMIHQLKSFHEKSESYSDKDYNDVNIADFSHHELNDLAFRSAISRLCESYQTSLQGDCKTCQNGLGISYCFKDVYNYSNKDVSKRKNQVHTRSIHAEENAFLQLAKYGSMGIEGGYLFTTASCCVLCAKKAYQLGIKKIIYIDAYPDISENHILKSGTKDSWPRMELYKGSIGKAYSSLYTALVPLKDEIEYMTGVCVKNVVKPTEAGSDTDNASEGSPSRQPKEAPITKT